MVISHPAVFCRVIVRGNKSDSAVLCTGDKTYDLKARETSNTLLLTEDTTLPDETKQETQPIAHRKVPGIFFSKGLFMSKSQS